MKKIDRKSLMPGMVVAEDIYVNTKKAILLNKASILRNKSNSKGLK